MAIEIGGISLERVHRISTWESADFVRHRIPGLEGDLVQDMGRASVRLALEGMFFGETATDDLYALRDLYKARAPIDFLAEISGQAYFAQVILEQFEVVQAAGLVGEYSYTLHIVEYVEPPASSPVQDLGAVDMALELETLDFMDMLELPDLPSVPDFSDPTPPLTKVLDGITGSLTGLGQSASTLAQLFGT